MNARDFDRVMSEALQPDHTGGPQPTVDLAATAWREGRRRRTRRLLAGGGGGVALVAAAAAAAFALNGGLTPDASVQIAPADTATSDGTYDGATDGTGTEDASTADATPPAEQTTPPSQEDEEETEPPSQDSEGPTTPSGDEEDQSGPEGVSEIAVPIGGGAWIDLAEQGEWDAVSMGTSSDGSTITCVTTSGAWATTGCDEQGIQVTGGLQAKPDLAEQRSPGYLLCAPQLTASVVSVEPASEGMIEIDGHPAESATWTATCDSGDTFELGEVWIPDAGILLADHVGVSVLANLAGEALVLSGEAPDLDSTVMAVTEGGGTLLSGEVQEWVVIEGEVVLPQGTGEMLTVSLEGASCLSGGEPAGLNEHLGTCDELLAEITAALESGGVNGTSAALVRIVQDGEGAVLTAGMQYLP